MTNGPEALARAPDGRVVFLDGGLPGERVEAEIVERRRDYARARVVRLLDPPGPSPERRTPPCPVVRQCGGCPWQHLHYAAQLERKQEMVLRELRRQGRIEPGTVRPAIGGAEWGARSRVRLAVARRGGGPPRIGYRARASHEVVAIQQCGIADPVIVAALPLVHVLARRVPALAEVEVLVDDRAELRLRAFVGADAPWTRAHAAFPRGEPVGEPSAERLLADLQAEARGHSLGAARLVGLSVEPRARPAQARWRVQAGDVEQKIEVAPGVVLRVPLGAFTQVNLALNRALVAEVLGHVAGAARVVDFYAGCGNFAIPIALAGAQVHAVESDEVAVHAAEAAARACAIAERCRFDVRTVEAAVRAGVLAGSPEAVVLDPPRAGAAAAVAALSPERAARVVYVSCEVSSFARDAAVLVKSGYRLDTFRLIDLTPQTHRAEVVGVFS